MAHVNALNKRTGKTQLVPAHYVDNPHLFGGRFVKAPAGDAPKSSRRRAGTADTPVTDEAATTDTPSTGEETTKE